MDEAKLTPAAKAALEAAKPKPKPWERPPGNTKEPPKGITALDLYGKDFPPPQFALDGLIGDGLTILCGKPKQGKSWLALLIAWAVAAGLEIDGRKTWQGEVLYLALEDTQRRLQSRMQRLNSELGWIVPETLTLHTTWPRENEMGLPFISEWLTDRQGQGRLIIIDTLAKFRRPPKGNANAYADDYETISGLKECVDMHKASALYIHHTRKLRAEDPFDEISGSNAISGSADTLIVLENDGGAGKLYVKGRDIAEATIPIQFSRDSGRWTLDETKEGIDTEGRIVEAGRQESKLEECMTWMKSFVAIYAYPSKEITNAGIKAGFTFTHLKNARVRLGHGPNGSKELTHHNFASAPANDWWTGKGTPQNWKLRPKPVGVSGVSGDSGVSEIIPE